MGYLDRSDVDRLLRDLHRSARSDRYRVLRLLPRLAVGFLQRKTFSEMVSPESLEGAFISVPREEGLFLYLTARAIGARTVVEFGTSFGISTIYLFLYDTLVIDILVLVIWHPRFLRLPDTEAFTSARYHLRTIPAGTILGVLMTLISTLISFYGFLKV